MARRKNLDPPVELKISLPASMHTKLSLLLWSESKQRVPHGAFSSFFTAILSDYLNRRAQREMENQDANRHQEIPTDAEGSIPGGALPGAGDQQEDEQNRG